jgi:hypothetical protein
MAAPIGSYATLPMTQSSDPPRVDMVNLAFVHQILSQQSTYKFTPPKSPRKIEFPDGRYIGEVKDGKPHGVGVFLYTMGHPYTKFIGDFVEGEKHGRGVLHTTHGHVHQGTWEKDKLMFEQTPEPEKKVCCSCGVL